uniref:Uncharacterized protein n=1 Tax=Rhizophora mucronata TaxID=61149 RepID=A0A2P2LVV5_RHIMU
MALQRNLMLRCLSILKVRREMNLKKTPKKGPENAREVQKSHQERRKLLENQKPGKFLLPINLVRPQREHLKNLH